MEKENLKSIKEQLKRLGFKEWAVDLGLGKKVILSVEPNHKSDNKRLRYCFNDTSIIETLKYAQMESLQEEKMKIINKSIDRLSKILTTKGYIGPYNIEGFHTEIIPDLFVKYCDAAFRNRLKEVFPFMASTYTKYNNDDTGYIRCFFTINFKKKSGVEITHMKATSCDRDHMEIEVWNKPIRSSLDIPAKDHVNKKVMPKAYHQKKKRGLNH